jgi:hypothetical protein
VTKVVDIGEEREKRKELCLYCGADPHPTQLACPRILHVEIDPEFGVIVGITFRKSVAGSADT